jgi:hypothetical protein
MARRLLVFALVSTVVACSGGTGCSGCAGSTTLPQGSFQGERLDSAASVRLSAKGFSFLNSDAGAGTILSAFAPGGQLVVAVPCTQQRVSLIGDLLICDEGQAGCTSEACGQMDGVCDAKDAPGAVTITIKSLHFAPKSPDVVVAQVSATVQTGLLHIDTVSRTPVICLFSSPLKCSIDFDTTHSAPDDNTLDVNLELAIDSKWDKLLSLKVSSIDGTKGCGSSGALPAPECIDPADITIASAGSCGACSAANFAIVKQLLVDQLASSLTTQLNDQVSQALCLKCDLGGSCPTSGTATATCQGATASAQGTCIDSVSGLCVPTELGLEGRADVGSLLGSLAAPGAAPLAYALGAGGSATADAQGATIGVRGGFQATQVASCVKPATPAVAAVLPLPDFDTPSPGPYDVSFSVSQQLLGRALFAAQQSGALCLEIGTETTSQLDSSLLGTLLPSLTLLTHGEDVPLRVVVRPVNAPTAVLGANTVDDGGTPVSPLVRLDWAGVQLDVYALLEERSTRLFTLQLDLSLPLGLRIDGCDTLTPVVGDLSQAVTNVQVLNSEVLAEPLDVLQKLVPSLITLAEPTLASSLPTFTLPELQGFKVKLLAAQGLGAISGSSTYNHLGIWAELYPATEVCPTNLVAPRFASSVLRRSSGATLLQVPPGEYSVRVDRGLWSMWTPAPNGVLELNHPRLKLGGVKTVELLGRDGARSSLVLQ